MLRRYQCLKEKSSQQTYILLEQIEEDNSCQNCGECICLHCDHREGNHSAECGGRCSTCEDIAINKCDEYKEADW